MCWGKRQGLTATRPADHASRISDDVASAFTGLTLIAERVVRAVALAFALDHPVYDCLYVALAEREQPLMVTSDRRFLARLRNTPHASRAHPLIA